MVQKQAILGNTQAQITLPDTGALSGWLILNKLWCLRSALEAHVAQKF